MTTKCYNLIACNDCWLAIENINNFIPCFTEHRHLGDNIIEFTITCRDEDIAFVEKNLAPFV